MNCLTDPLGGMCVVTAIAMIPIPAALLIVGAWHVVEKAGKKLAPPPDRR